MEITKLVLEYIKVIIWPLTTFIILILYKSQITLILKRFRRAELPGGITVETFPEEIREAKELSSEVKEETLSKKTKRESPTIPLTEANARMLNLGLTPSPSGLDLSYYRVLADQDPTLALAGLRIEVETMLKNLAIGFKVPISGREGISIIVRRLREGGHISALQADLINVVIRLCNAAVHGLKVTVFQVEEILDIAKVLRDHYISWLGWGFGDNWKAKEPKDTNKSS